MERGKMRRILASQDHVPEEGYLPTLHGTGYLPTMVYAGYTHLSGYTSPSHRHAVVHAADMPQRGLQALERGVTELTFRETGVSVLPTFPVIDLGVTVRRR